MDKKITVGAGKNVGLFISNQGHRLFCYTASKGSPYGYPGYYEINSFRSPFEPSIRVIDTASNEIIANYKDFDSFRADLKPKEDWFFSTRFLAANDKGAIIALLATSDAGKFTNPSDFFTKRLTGQRLVVFSNQSPEPLVTVDPGGRIVTSMLSKDEKFFFAAVTGNERPAGSLIVVDLEKGTVVHHALTGNPTSLLRIGSQQELWVFSGEVMRAVSETGELEDRQIQLNKPVKSDKDSASAFIDSQPGQIISLGEDKVAILIYNKYIEDGSRHKVALIDLKKLQVDAILPTMSSGEIARIKTGRIIKAVATVEIMGTDFISTTVRYDDAQQRIARCTAG